jgi:hypothetical protein
MIKRKKFDAGLLNVVLDERLKANALSGFNNDSREQRNDKWK